MDRRLSDILVGQIERTRDTLARLKKADEDFLTIFPDIEARDRTSYFPLVTSHVIKIVTVSGLMGSIIQAFLEMGWKMTSPNETRDYLVVFTYDRDNYPDPYQVIITTRAHEEGATNEHQRKDENNPTVSR